MYWCGSKPAVLLASCQRKSATCGGACAEALFNGAVLLFGFTGITRTSSSWTCRQAPVHWPGLSSQGKQDCLYWDKQLIAELQMGQAAIRLWVTVCLPPPAAAATTCCLLSWPTTSR